MSDGEQEKEDEIDWRLLNIYRHGSSSSRRVTRSQTAFHRIENTPSDSELFANKDKHNPPGKPHLIETLKGKYGAIPNTVVTRSFSKYLSVSENLCNAVNDYKQGGYEDEGKVSSVKKGETSSIGKVEKPVEKKKSTEEKESSSTISQKPAPKEEKSAPKAEKPAPKVEKPAPKEEKPAPKEEKPAPKEEKPAPKEEKAAPKAEEPVQEAEETGSEKTEELEEPTVAEEGSKEKQETAEETTDQKRSSMFGFRFSVGR